MIKDAALIKSHEDNTIKGKYCELREVCSKNHYNNEKCQRGTVDLCIPCVLMIMKSNLRSLLGVSSRSAQFHMSFVAAQTPQFLGAKVTVRLFLFLFHFFLFRVKVNIEASVPNH